METKIAIIGLTGKKRSGKDTVCQILKDKFKCVQRVAFADALKEELARALGEPLQRIEERKDVFRLGLQWYGSEYRRGLYGDDYWIKQAEVKYNACLDWKPDAVIFTDVRFPNEAALIRNLGGRLWRVMRLCGDRDQDQHVSETALDATPVDRIIHNYGSLLDLRDHVLRAVLQDFGNYQPGGGFA